MTGNYQTDRERFWARDACTEHRILQIGIALYRLPLRVASNSALLIRAIAAWGSYLRE
jgi:hypothetical protein